MVGQHGSCRASYSSIHREGKIVYWLCDTAGSHKQEFSTVEEAEHFLEKLKAISLSLPWIVDQFATIGVEK
jgi:hypothetical protein